jgi:hypothetical protein
MSWPCNLSVFELDAGGLPCLGQDLVHEASSETLFRSRLGA